MSKDPRRDLAQAGSLGFTLVAFVLVFTGLGYLVDRWLGTRPWLMVAGVFVGAAFGFVYMIQVLIADSKKSSGRGRGDGKDGAPDGRADLRG